MKVLRVNNEQLAKQAEEFIFTALKPGGFSHDESIPLPNLKDKLAWLSWANLMRYEQPSLVVIDDDEIVGGMFGEPVETTFDEGEAEIQHPVVFNPGIETEELAFRMLTQMMDFYQQNDAKQVHFWVLEDDLKRNKFKPWQQVAVDRFGFEFKGFKRISKWRNKPVCKIQKYF